MIRNRIVPMLLMAFIVALPAMARGKGGNVREVVSPAAAQGIEAIELIAPVTVEVIQSGDNAGSVSYRTAASDDPLVVERIGKKLVVRSASAYKNGRDMKMKSSVKVCCGRVITSVTVTGSGDVRIPDISAGKTVELIVTGSGDIEVQSLKAATLRSTVTGSGDIDLKSLEAKNAVFSLTGSGNIDVEGHAGTVGAELTGSGDIDMKKLRSDIMKITLAGSGDVKCGVPTRLTADIHGSGDITVYGGTPESVSISGNKRNLKFKND